jgi:hypothetical protein
VPSCAAEAPNYLTENKLVAWHIACIKINNYRERAELMSNRRGTRQGLPPTCCCVKWLRLPRHSGSQSLNCNGPQHNLALKVLALVLIRCLLTWQVVVLLHFCVETKRYKNLFLTVIEG